VTFRASVRPGPPATAVTRPGPPAVSRVGPPGVTRTVLLIAAALAAVLLPASPAAAHAADAPVATNYRTTVTGVSPALDGLTVRAIEAGARLELVNRTTRPIEVLGYQGEPYLLVAPDGVYSNVHSPATYLNETLAMDLPVPQSADPARAPSWQRVSDEPVARWHDRRAMWVGSGMPPEVAADPGRPHHIRDWVVPLRDGMSAVEVTGTLEWVPPPPAAAWWAAIVVATLLVGTLGLRWDRVPAAFASLAAAAGLLAIGYAVARELDAGAATVGGVLAGLVEKQMWAVLTGLGALAAAVYGSRRRAAADLALGLAGACLALIAGVANAAVLTHGVAPVPVDPAWARAATAFVIAAGFGLALAAVLRLRTASRAAGGPSTQRRPVSQSTDSAARHGEPTGAA